MQRFICVAKEFREAQQETSKVIEKLKTFTEMKVRFSQWYDKKTFLSLEFRAGNPLLERNVQARLITFWI